MLDQIKQAKFIPTQRPTAATQQQQDGLEPVRRQSMDSGNLVVA